MRCLAPILVAGFLALLPSSGLAGPSTEPVVALHYGPTCDKCFVDVCGTNSPVNNSLPCSDFSMLWRPTGGGGFRGFIVVARADSAAGVSAFQFQVSYTPSTSVFQWYLCADEEYPAESWPASGSGNRVIWDAEANCQRQVIGSDGVHVLVGAMYMYMYPDGAPHGAFTVTPDSSLVDPAFILVDCSGQETRFASKAGVIAVGSYDGYNPCSDPSPIRRTTWGQLKQLN